MVVTMDGPAGAGKSSMARKLAERLGFAFLDTGAMYRSVTLRCLQRHVSLDDSEAIAAIAETIALRFDGSKVYLDDDDVTESLRTAEVTQSIRPIADNHRVRAKLVQLQRAWANDRDLVTEGRDQGTVAFPAAECKIFLTASPEERARRRAAQLEERGERADYEAILIQQAQRDKEDTARSHGGLKIADDAIVVETDGLTEEEVLDRLVQLVRSRDPRICS